jgi:hypothetical protein
MEKFHQFDANPLSSTPSRVASKLDAEMMRQFRRALNTLQFYIRNR